MRWAACVVAVVVLAGDQVSKSLVLAARPGPGDGGFVSVRLVRNTGASFGVGAGHPVPVMLAAAVVIAVVAVLLARTRSRVAALCLAAVLGGALGNLADMAIRVGAVGAVAVMLGAQARLGRWLCARRA